MLSLPLVFLAYSLCALLTGIGLYALRASGHAPFGMIAKQFEAHARWTIGGALGGLVGSAILAAVLA